MSACPRCQYPVQVRDRLSGIEDGAGDLAGAGLYHCGYCTLDYVLFADGSTVEAVFEESENDESAP